MQVDLPLKIIGLGRYLPRRIVPNSEVEALCGLSAGWVERRNGVRERRWVTDETSSFMSAEAAREALTGAKLKPNQLDLIINASGTGEQAIPDTGALIQRQLGLGKSGIPAMTVHTTCLSFIAAMDVASNFINSGRYKNILIASADVSSCGINPKEPESATLVGDAAAAVVVTRPDYGDKSMIHHAHFKTYGEGAYLTAIMGGGSARHPRFPNHNPEDDLFHMDGPAVLRMVREIADEFLEELYPGLSKSIMDIDVVVPHQASKVGLMMLERFGWPKSKIMSTLETLGNCVAASIPATLYQAVCDENIQRGDKVLLVGTGAGLSIGGLVITYYAPGDIHVAAHPDYEYSPHWRPRPRVLELARAFHRAGHTVFMAESLREHLSQPSNAIKANFVVPAPRQETDAFIIAIKTIIEENKIDLLIPTCEEIFYIAMRQEELPCAVFAESITKLDQLHNKWSFIINAVEYGLSVPESMLITTLETLFHAYSHWRELVLKPTYSRFATRTLILPPLKQASSTLTFHSNSAWVAQGYIRGTEICTYSICHNGHITAHTAYPSIFTAGQGATIAFQHIDNPAIFNWIKSFVVKNNFTGQIAFDFIQTPEGQIYALECNPRATSGVHLLASHPQFVEAFFNPQMDCITPIHNSSHMLSTAMLIYGLPVAFKKNNVMQWIKTFFTSNDVILDFKDPLPLLLQFKSLLAAMKLAREKGISPIEAVTFDIEWNGE